jgi:hypothetical protein
VGLEARVGLNGTVNRDRNEPNSVGGTFHPSLMGYGYLMNKDLGNVYAGIGAAFPYSLRDKKIRDYKVLIPIGIELIPLKEVRNLGFKYEVHLSYGYFREGEYASIVLKDLITVTYYFSKN